MILYAATANPVVQTVLQQYGHTIPIVLAGMAAFLCTIVVVRSHTTWKTYTNLPPRGPREWPVLGSLPSLAGKQLPHEVLATLAKKYGPIFSTQLGSFYSVVISDYSLLKKAFTRSNDDFSDRPKLAMFEYVVSGNGLIASYHGQMQTEHRRFTLSALRSLGMGKFRMEETIAEEVHHLAQSFASHESQPFVPFHDIIVSVSNIISWLTFGKRFEYEDMVFKSILGVVFDSFELAEVAGLYNFIPILRFFPGSGIKKVKANQDKFDEVMKPLVEKIRCDRNIGSPTCYIEMYADHILQAEEENPGKHTFNNKNLFHAVADLFVAGTETTATTLKWALLYMITHERVQEKVHQELDSVIGRKRLPGLRDRPNLPYVEATLLEIQRFASITPLGVPHAPIRDTVLEGYDIPKGTVVIPNMWCIHHDPDLWQNPDQFNPDRFLDPEENHVIHREELIPFSTGRRRCLGEQLAKVELFLFFTHLLHRFRFKEPEGVCLQNIGTRNGATINPEKFDMCAILRDSMF